MTRRAASLIAALAVGFAPAVASARATFIPVASGQFTTGQWYFNGTKSGLGGNAALMLVPAVRYSNQLSLIPTVETNYRGTRSAEELAGGTTLFQDTWENAVGLKAVHNLNGSWTLRERVGARSKWFRETTDETWNHGLYDYRTATIGAEVERKWASKASVALGYDFSLLRFPNYQSLESGQSSDLAREFAGTNVLDERIHLASLRVNAPLPWKTLMTLQTLYSPRSYTDQTVVQLSGLLSSTKRTDTMTGGSLVLDRIFPIRSAKLDAAIQGGYTSFDSNQNHYDAQQTAFIADFYDYDQRTIGAQLVLGLGSNEIGPMTFELGSSYAVRNYRSRVIQSIDGAYGHEKLSTVETNVALGFSYPLSRNLRARFTSSVGRARSNNDYEAVYRYNYNSSNYQFGFSYEY